MSTEQNIKSDDVKRVIDAVNATLARECWTREHRARLRGWLNTLEEMHEHAEQRELSARALNALYIQPVAPVGEGL